MNGDVYFKKAAPNLQVMAKEATEENLEEIAEEIRGRVEDGVVKFRTAVGLKTVEVGQYVVEFQSDIFVVEKDWFFGKYEAKTSEPDPENDGSDEPLTFYEEGDEDEEGDGL